MNFINKNKSLNHNGYIIYKNISDDEVNHLLNHFGIIIHENFVTADINSKSLTNSFKKLSLHTDHHKADLVCLFCITQSESGGESILLDTRNFLEKFSSLEKEILSSIYLKEHKVFKNDPDFYPLLTNLNDFYYSYWLVKNDLTTQQSSVLNKLKNLIENEMLIQFKLQNNSLLILDNKRMLHGRTEILENQKRILKRYWLKRRTK